MPAAYLLKRVDACLWSSAHSDPPISKGALLQDAHRNTFLFQTDAPVRLRSKHLWGLLGHWVGALLPTAVVMYGAVFVFQQSVLASIASTPHPELVYIILGTFLAGVVLTCITLMRYTREGNLIERWQVRTPAQRVHMVSHLRGATYLLPLFEVLLGQRALSAHARQSVLELEMASVNAHLHDRLALPNYLAGALVGLGLVGTFVGLLGTLEDLGKLFGALVQTGSASTNPAEIFSDMVRRLQDPMRGMGTAFVASLYGLLGSLVLGLQILSVGKMGHAITDQVHTMVRQADRVPTLGEAEVAGLRSADADMPTSTMHAQEWQKINRFLQTAIAQSQREFDAMRREVLHLVQANQTLTEQAIQKVTQSIERSCRGPSPVVQEPTHPQDPALQALSLIVHQQGQTLAEVVKTLTRLDAHLNTHYSD